ncbi:unnamed protein product [Owenia fusiformis]|uniref:Uncharacterized protein n=1 Tax=Owenia fusiformis TaxID=6347 RepID=A0A8J1U532_OWEFU|nr:unnamed protein product [Owenia fusiformis]
MQNLVELSSLQIEDSGEKTRANKLLASLIKQRKDGSMCDIKLKIGDDFVHAHKCILVSSSKYFERMFLGNFEENQGEVDLSGSVSSKDVLNAILDFIYSGKLLITDENIEGLVQCATFFLLDDAQKFCEQYLLSNLTIDTCIRTYCLSEMYNLTDLYTIAEKVMKSKFQDVILRNEILSVPYDYLKRLLSNTEMIQLCSAKHLITLLCRWSRYSPDERVDHFSSLWNIISDRLYSDVSGCGKCLETCFTEVWCDMPEEKRMEKQYFSTFLTEMETRLQSFLGSDEISKKSNEYLIAFCGLPRRMVIYSPTTNAWHEYRKHYMDINKSLMSNFEYFIGMTEQNVYFFRKKRIYPSENSELIPEGKVMSLNLESGNMSVYATFDEVQESTVIFVTVCNQKICCLVKSLSPQNGETKLKANFSVWNAQSQKWEVRLTLKDPAYIQDRGSWIQHNGHVYVVCVQHAQDQGASQSLGQYKAVFYDYNSDEDTGTSFYTCKKIGTKDVRLVMYELQYVHSGIIVVMDNYNTWVCNTALKPSTWEMYPNEVTLPELTSLPLNQEDHFKLPEKDPLDSSKLGEWYQTLIGDHELHVEYRLRNDLESKRRGSSYTILPSFPTNLDLNELRLKTMYMKGGFIEKLPLAEFIKDDGFSEHIHHPYILDGFKGLCRYANGKKWFDASKVKRFLKKYTVPTSASTKNQSIDASAEDKQ